MRAGSTGVAMALWIAGTGMALAQAKPAEDEPQRQLGAHAHGQGKLSIAVEKRTLEIELEAPGADIVGFEHAAKTAEQKAAIAKARAALAKPLDLFKLPEGAGCKQTSAKVKLVGGGAHDHGHSHGHSHGKQAPAKGSKAADPHSEFHAEYTFACAKPDLLQAIEVEYFKTFPGAEALEVTFIGNKGQSKQKVTRDKPRIELRAGN